MDTEVDPDSQMSTAAAVPAAVDALGDPDRARGAARFFKTGPGDYGEGDTFVGVSVPALRRLVRSVPELPPQEVVALLGSDVHEHRLVGLFLLRAGFERALDEAERELWVTTYLDLVYAGRVNNWDLVDSSADPVLGEWLIDRSRGLLTELASDDDLWRRRVAIVATFAFIKRGDAGPLFEIAPLVLDDRRDLIQKAFGWMLREAGKRCDRGDLVAYLEANAPAMGRTALSYATEHMSADERAELRARR